MLSQRHQTTTLNLLLGRRPESIGGEGNDSSQSPPCLAPDVTLRGGLAFIARWDPFRAHQRNTPQKAHKTKERIPNEPSRPRYVCAHTCMYACVHVRNFLSFWLFSLVSTISFGIALPMLSMLSLVSWYIMLTPDIHSHRPRPFISTTTTELLLLTTTIDNHEVRYYPHSAVCCCRFGRHHRR